MSKIGKTFRIRKDLKLHEVLGECKVTQEIFNIRGQIGTITRDHSRGKYYTSFSDAFIVSDGMIEVGNPVKMSAQMVGYVEITVMVPEGEKFNLNRAYYMDDNEPEFDQLLKGINEFEITVVKELREKK